MLYSVSYPQVVEAISHKENWPEDEARAIVDSALAAGYDLNEIVGILFHYGINTLILNSWSRVTFHITRGPL